MADPDTMPMAVDDALVTTAVDAGDHLEQKMAALRAHASQVAVDGVFFALSDNIGSRAFAVEHYRLVKGEPAGPFDADGRETDLFAGV